MCDNSREIGTKASSTHDYVIVSVQQLEILEMSRQHEEEAGERTRWATVRRTIAMVDSLVLNIGEFDRIDQILHHIDRAVGP